MIMTYISITHMKAIKVLERTKTACQIKTAIFLNASSFQDISVHKHYSKYK